MSKEEIKMLAREVLEAMTAEAKDKRLHNTRLLMKNYNALKEHIDNVNEDIEEFELEVEDGTKDGVWIMSIARSKLRTAKMLGYIDSAMELLEERFRKNGEMEKYRAFTLFFIEKKTNEEIQEILTCGKNSPKRWSDLIINELSILLWGIDALGI